MTPIQQLIIELAKHEKAGKDKMVAECIVRARRLLPAERKLISDTWDAAVTWNTNDGFIQMEESAPPPDKQTYINSLNSDK